jgi:hypothetical protein
MTRSILSLMLVLAVSGCGGTTFVNKKYLEAQRLSSSSDRLVIMPVEAHRFGPGLRPGIETFMNRELKSSFGARGVEVMPLKAQLAPAGFANLGWRLALGMHYRAKEKKDPKLTGDYYDWLDELAPESVKFVRWLKTALAGGGGGAGGSGRASRYILTGYVERLEKKKTKEGKPLLTFRVMVGIFDVQRARIVVSTWKYLSCKPTLTAIRGLLTGMGAHARKQFGPVFQ